MIETNQYKVHYTFPEAVILAFLAYLRGCAGHDPVIPKTAFNYLSGVKFMMVNLGIDTKFIDQSAIINGVKTGMYKSWRKEEGNKIMDRITLPLVLSMILNIRKSLLKTDRRIDHCHSAAQIHSYTTLSRVSEFVPTRTSNHCLLTKHVIFEVMTDTNTIINVMAESVWQYAFKQIQGITVVIGAMGTKNDPDGEGHKYHYKTDKTYDHDRDQNNKYCYVQTMYSWACSGRPTSNQPFFSCNTDPSPWTISQRLYAMSIKAGAALCGVHDTRRYTTKSLRIAAASALAAANIPDYTIKQLGRWKSNAFLIYIRNSTKAFQYALEALTNTNTLTQADLLHWHPGITK